MKYKKTIREQILKDAKKCDDSYIKEVAENGCIGGNCRNLIYYKDTHAFYDHYTNEIDEILERIADEMGEDYDITANMKRLGQSDLRNFLVWLAYEAEAQKILDLDEEENEPLLCVADNCKELQTTEGEYCEKHNPKKRAECKKCGKVAFLSGNDLCPACVQEWVKHYSDLHK